MGLDVQGCKALEDKAQSWGEKPRKSGEQVKTACGARVRWRLVVVELRLLDALPRIAPARIA
jgi:hypothetical protein